MFLVFFQVTVEELPLCRNSSPELPKVDIRGSWGHAFWEVYLQQMEAHKWVSCSLFYLDHFPSTPANARSWLVELEQKFVGLWSFTGVSFSGNQKSGSEGYPRGSSVAFSLHSSCGWKTELCWALEILRVFLEGLEPCQGSEDMFWVSCYHVTPATPRLLKVQCKIGSEYILPMEYMSLAS